MKNTSPEEKQLIFKELEKYFKQNSTINENQFAYIFDHFVVHRIKKNQYIVQENNHVHYEYFVLKGLLKSYFTNDEGKEYIIEFAREHCWISDYQAYFNQTNATLNIDAIEDCLLLGISFHDRKKLSSEVNGIGCFFIERMSNEYIKLQERICSLLNDTPKVQLEKLSSHCPELLQRVSKTKIASYLGVARETLSRIK